MTENSEKQYSPADIERIIRKATNEALEEAAKWHDAEIERLHWEITKNDNHAYIPDDETVLQANKVYRDQIEAHQRSAEAIREMKEP